MPDRKPTKVFRNGSVAQRLLEHMMNGGTVSSWDFEKFRCTSITQRIHDLRRAGYNIISTPKKSSFGAPYDEYSMPAPVQPELFTNQHNKNGRI